jgi:transcriptional regulator with XRE-family HTH domain
MISGAQCKAARELLGWSPLDLGFRARVSEPAVAAFEESLRHVRPASVQAIMQALEAAGIEFSAENGGVGVRLRKGKP